MLRFLAIFVVIMSVIMRNDVALGNACGCQNGEFCMGQGCYTCNVYDDTYHHAYSPYIEYNDAEVARRESCDANGSGQLVCKNPYTPVMVQIADSTYGYSCRCDNNSYEYKADGLGVQRPVFECKRCDEANDPDNKRECPIVSDSVVWFGVTVNGFGCKDGYHVTDSYTNEDPAERKYGCACDGANEYIYEDANGYKTCKTCPSDIFETYEQEFNPGYEHHAFGVKACGYGQFSCKNGFMLSRSDDGYKCADCHFYGNRGNIVSAWTEPVYEDENQSNSNQLCSYEENCSTSICNHCFQDSPITVVLHENCVATLTLNDADNVGATAGTCNVIQTYSANMERLGDYDTNVSNSRDDWSVVTDFSKAGPGSYFVGNGTSNGTCKLCKGDTYYSYGGTYVDACFTKPNNATMVSSGDVNVGFTCNNAGTFKNGNALCQSCPVAMGTNNTAMNVEFDSTSTKTGIAACYINAGQTFKNEHGTLKISNACYAQPETAGGTVKFCVTSNTCAEKLAEAVSDIVNVNADSLKTICNSQNTNWANLPSGLNDYIDILETVGCMQWYVEYDIQN
ncbi:MAG: hypothetical protein J6S74_01885 [Alphaproteobacteria bacterium]|nr:hypothetical protein [Alphaproteobacteria bacterium]